MSDDLRVSDKSVARALLEQAEQDWQAQAESDAARYVERLKDAAGRCEPVAAVLDAVHAPCVDPSRPEDGLCCTSCTDGPYYDTEAAPWPCKTVLAIANAIPGSGAPPESRRYPNLNDFYREPDVTFTLAHHSKIGDDHYMPGQKVTMPLSEARRYRYRMTAEAWPQIDRMLNQ